MDGVRHDFPDRGSFPGLARMERFGASPTMAATALYHGRVQPPPESQEIFLQQAGQAMDRALEERRSEEQRRSQSEE